MSNILGKKKLSELQVDIFPSTVRAVRHTTEITESAMGNLHTSLVLRAIRSEVNVAANKMFKG